MSVVYQMSLCVLVVILGALFSAAAATDKEGRGCTTRPNKIRVTNEAKKAKTAPQGNDMK